MEVSFKISNNKKINMQIIIFYPHLFTYLLNYRLLRSGTGLPWEIYKYCSYRSGSGKFFRKFPPPLDFSLDFKNLNLFL